MKTTPVKLTAALFRNKCRMAGLDPIKAAADTQFGNPQRTGWVRRHIAAYELASQIEIERRMEIAEAEKNLPADVLAWREERASLRAAIPANITGGTRRARYDRIDKKLAKKYGR